MQEVDDLSRPSSRSDSDYDASQSASSSPAHEEDSHDSPNNSNSSQTPDGDDWDVDNSLDSGAQSMQQPQPQPQPQPREDGAIPSSKDVFDFSFAPWDDIVGTLLLLCIFSDFRYHNGHGLRSNSMSINYFLLNVQKHSAM